jgi:putative membrane protein
VNQPPRIDRQREHQANERTFLAWVRTSIALISFGLAIARFGLFLRELQEGVTQTSLPPNPISSQTIGLVLVLAGMVMIILAAWGYNRAFRQIERGNYQPNRWIIWVTTLGMLLIGGLSLPFVLWQPPSGREAGQRQSRRLEPRQLELKQLEQAPKQRQTSQVKRWLSNTGRSVSYRSLRSNRIEKRTRLSQLRFSDNRRMKVYRRQSLGKRQTVA